MDDLNIKLAQAFGFCWGVERAVAMAYETRRHSYHSWAYLFSGTIILLIMGLHGSLGAWLASDFGVHITADQLLVKGIDLTSIL